MEHVQLEVNGMTCDACVKAVERRLKGLPGVRAAKVNLDTKVATVEKDSGTTNAEDMIAAVERLGYSARVM